MTTKKETETWRELPLWGKNTRYQVSNKGRVKSICMIQGVYEREKILKTHIVERHGLKSICVSIRHKGKNKTYFVHKLVALCFVDNPNNYKYIKHIDGNFENNEYTNLMWVKSSYCGSTKPFGVSKNRTLKIVHKTIAWLYEQHNNGRLECGDIENFISDYQKAML